MTTFDPTRSRIPLLPAAEPYGALAQGLLFVPDDPWQRLDDRDTLAVRMRRLFERLAAAGHLAVAAVSSLGARPSTRIAVA